MEPNLANQEIDYKVSEGQYFVTKTFVYPNGRAYTETTSTGTLLGWPLFQMTIGRCPETGRRRVAKAWLAVGRIAFGGIAVGQLGIGIVAIAQLGIGLTFALAQLGVSAHTSVAQIGIASKAAYGQLSVAGEEAIGQVAVARYAMGQVGVGRYVYDVKRRDHEALEHFAPILDRMSQWQGGENRGPLEESPRRREQEPTDPS